VEHYSKIPRALRQRTMVFVALDGHHNSAEGSAVGNQWIIQNRQKLFAKTALAINVEHPSTIQTQSRPRYYNANEIVWGNSYLPQQWYAGGPSRPELQQIVADAFKQFGATLALFASTGAITQVEHGGNLSDGAGASGKMSTGTEHAYDRSLTREEIDLGCDSDCSAPTHPDCCVRGRGGVPTSHGTRTRNQAAW
jgi:hypothetical protein